MGIVEWWTTKSRSLRNSILVLLADVLLLLGALFAVPGLQFVWESLTETMPNLYEAIFLQLLALVRDAAPGSVVAPSVLIVYSTLFLSLLTVHLLIAYGIGYLMQRFHANPIWSLTNYVILGLVLGVFHAVLILGHFWFY